MFTTTESKAVDMNTIRFRMPKQAKKLIETFEKGELFLAKKSDDDDSGNAPEAAFNGIKTRLNREVTLEELAPPGTARKLLMEYESFLKKTGRDVPLTSTGLRARLRLSKVDFSANNTENEAATKSEVANVDRSADEVAEIQAKEDKVGAAAAAENIGLVNGERGVVELADNETLTDEVAESQRNNDAADEVVPVLEILETAITSAVDPDAPDTTSASDLLATTNNAVEEIREADEPSSSDSNTILIVYAVKEETALDRAVLDKTVQQFREARHSVFVSELGELVATSDVDVEEERGKVAAADLLVVIYQPEFRSVPASFQAWFEAVFTLEQYNEESFKNKRCIMLLTTKHPEEIFTVNTVFGDILSYIWPSQTGLLHQIGFDILEPYAIFNTGEADIDDANNKWLTRLAGIWNETAANRTW